MTKQDIHDIIQLLESHFESAGKEVRKELRFSFVEEDMDFTFYDSEYLFMQYDINDNEYQANSIKSDLKIQYYEPFNCNAVFGTRPVVYGSREVKNIEDILKSNAKNEEFHLKSYQYLTQEFKIVYLRSDDGMEFIIEDSERINEKLNLKKFNQI